jgi:SAM-dependent methyltransferase
MSSYAYFNTVRQDILRMIPSDGTTLGSVGCGYATTEAELVKAGRIVYGVDIAPAVEAVARAHLSRFDLVKPGDPLPWAPRSLDGLLLADVIEHLPAAWDTLAAWSQCVRVGGWVAVSVPNMRNIEVLARFGWSGEWPERDTGIYDRTHLQVMSQRRLNRWADSAGLDFEREFNSYDPNGQRRTRFFRLLDYATLKLFHHLMMYQVQCVYRVRKPAE